MSERRVFEGFTPPVGVTWIVARIDEASIPSDDAATAIESITLVPPITNPDDPPTYTLVTTNATLSVGWYRIVWLDASGIQQATAWIERRLLSPYAPTVGDIAAILRARTVETGGFRVDTFTDQTTPTAQQVQALIELHTPLVFASLGPLAGLACTNAGELLAGARSLAAQRIALEVEASYWPDELGSVTAVDVRRQTLDTATDKLGERIEECRGAPAGGDGGESVSRSDPAYTFGVWKRICF